MSIKDQIEAFSDDALITTFEVNKGLMGAAAMGLNTRIESTDLKALAASHTRLQEVVTKTVRDMTKNAGIVSQLTLERLVEAMKEAEKL